MDSCCIYILYWDISNPYIGQTVSFEKRKRAHINALNRGTHDNFKIQNYYNKYQSLPIIEILIACQEKDLNTLEEQFIEEFDSINNGLNIISGGYSVGSGIHNPASLYSETNLVEAFNLLADSNNSYKIITELTGIPKDTLTKISGGIQHIWLKERFPEVYERVRVASKERYTNSRCASGQGKIYRRIRSPEGIVYEVTNTLQFSKQHNLPNGNLNLVLTGKRNSVKGWFGVD